MAVVLPPLGTVNSGPSLQWADIRLHEPVPQALWFRLDPVWHIDEAIRAFLTGNVPPDPPVEPPL